MPTVDQLSQTTALVSDKPLAFVAAFFALLSIAQFLLNQHQRDRKDAEIAQLNADMRAATKEQTTILVDTMKALSTLPPKKHRARREEDPPDGETKAG